MNALDWCKLLVVLLVANCAIWAQEEVAEAEDAVEPVEAHKPEPVPPPVVALPKPASVAEMLSGSSLSKGCAEDFANILGKGDFEFYYKINNECDKLLEQIDKKFPEGKIINVCDVKNDEDILNVIIKYFNYMNILAVGINAKIYSIEVFDRIAGDYTIKFFYRVKEIIDFRRRVRNASYVCADFENLILDLIKLREDRFSKHDKDFAKMRHEI